MTHNEQSSHYNVGEDAFTVHLIDDRRTIVSSWARGNPKLGPDIFTYSKLPGRQMGTCPGSSPLCELVCYAKRVVTNSWVWKLWTENTQRGDELPPLPEGVGIVRIHVSGDFDTEKYIFAWLELARARPDVQFFGYTRSWRVPELLAALWKLWELPNVHLFASTDTSIPEVPPREWRVAWLEGDDRVTLAENGMTGRTLVGRKVLVCPEERGRKANCQECGYCFKSGSDVYFLESSPNKSAWTTEAAKQTLPRV